MVAHPREDEDRCAVRAELRDEPMLGTAFTKRRVLLVEQPGPWGHDGLRESDFDRAVAAELDRRAEAAGVRVLAIRRPGRHHPGGPRRWAVADCGSGELRWGRYDSDDELLDVPLDGSTGDVDTEPVYLVCTHGKHDRCCAVRGRPVAAALDELRPGRVWESSHLGGHRFAANVLVLPSGLLYGRVLPVAAVQFVAAAEADEVIGGLLRGRVGLAPVAQAALAFAYDHLGLRQRTALRVESESAAGDGQSIVRLDGPHGGLDVTVRVEAVATDGLSCDKPGPAKYLRFRPIRIEAVAP